MSQPKIRRLRVSIKADPRRMSLTSKHRRIAHGFPNQAEFEKFIAKLRPEAQGTAREILVPYLNFKLAVAEARGLTTFTQTGGSYDLSSRTESE